MATLNTPIAIFAGHDKPQDGQSAEFFGPVGDFVQANADAMDGDAVQAMLDDLDAHGCHLIGGGAAPAFIALKVTPEEPAYSRLMSESASDAAGEPSTVH